MLARVFKILILKTLFFTLIFLPVNDLFAAGSLNSQPSFGKVNSKVNISGNGFKGGENVDVFFDQKKIKSAKSEGNGDLKETSFEVPCSTPNQRHSISAIGSSSKTKAEKSFFVQPIPVSITVKASDPKPGKDIEISGRGFLSEEKVKIVFDKEASSSGVPAGSIKTDKKGSLNSQKLPIPPDVKGEKVSRITAIGDCSQSSANSSIYLQGFYPNASPSNYAPKVGTKITFSGNGFIPGEKIGVFLGDPNNSKSVANLKADKNGTFKNLGEFKIPKDTITGMKSSFTLIGEKSKKPVTISLTFQDFNVSITLSSYFGLPGNTILRFSGNGFVPKERVDVYFGGGGQGKGKLVNVFMTDDQGDFKNKGEFTLPFGIRAGENVFNFVGRESNKPQQAVFNVGAFTANIVPSNFAPLPGNSIAFSGSGFPPNEPIQIYFNNQLVGSAFSDSKGSFKNSAKIQVPYGLGGQAQIKAVGSLSGTSAIQNLELQALRPSVTPSTFFGAPESVVTIKGNSFAPNEHIIVKFDEVNVSEAQTDGKGNFDNVTFSVPSGLKGGEHTVNVSGDKSKATGTFPFSIGEGG